MECRNVQEMLSAYMEGDIAVPEMALIDEHLRSCQKCSTSLAELKKTLHYIRNLEEVEPPPWMTQKISARIKSGSRQEKSIWQRLFYPLHIKLPIEAAGAILIAVTALFVFRTIDPEKKLAKIPPEETQTLKEHADKRTGLRDDKQVPRKEFSAERETPVKPPSEQKGTDIPAAESPKSAGKMRPEDEKEFVAKSYQPIKQREPAPSAGTVARDESMHETRLPETQMKASFETKREDIPWTVSVKDAAAAKRGIATAITQMNGKIIKTDSFADRYILTAELDAQRMSELIAQIKTIGNLEEKVTVLDLKGEIRIRIEIVEKAY